MNRTKKFLRDGLILAISAVFMRTVGVSWNAYVSNKVGMESMGLLSLVMSVYGFTVTLACSGVGFGVTRTVSEALGKNDLIGAYQALKTAVWYSVIFGSMASFSLYFGADMIGCTLLSDKRTVASIRVMSLSMLPISLSSVFNGYFNAVRRVHKSAVIGILEQLVRMTACIMLFGVFLPKGVEGGCIAIVSGGCVAECLSAVYSAILCMIDKKRNLMTYQAKRTTVPKKEQVKALVSISIPIAVSTYIRSALVTLEHMLIPKALRMNGMTHSAALSSYGMLGSMVLPLILYPASLTSSFASLLIPELAESKAKGDAVHIKRTAMKAIVVTFAFSACVSGIMLSYSGSLGRVIYNSTDAGKYIRLLAPVIPIMYLDTVVDSMLKGLGYQVYTMTVNIIDAALCVIGVILLIPRLGILGYVILISVSELVNASASIFKLSQVLRLNIPMIKVIFLPTFFSIASCMTVRCVYSHVLYLSPESIFGLCVHISTVVLLYGILCGCAHIIPKVRLKLNVPKPFAV